MDTKSVINLQKKGIVMHRVIYIAFIVLRFLLQIMSKELLWKNTICVISFVVICWVFEEGFLRVDFLKSILVLRIVRYVQFVSGAAMLCFMQNHDASDLSVIALLIMFMVDYFLTMGVSDYSNLTHYMLYVSLPIIAVIVVKVSLSVSMEWIFLFLDMLIVLLVLFFEAQMFISYMDGMDNLLYNQRYEFENVVEKNENIMQMQSKLQNTNDALAQQKINLQNANRQINLANQEMVAQTEILHYISMSFDVSKISNQITDSIMQVRKLGFCAVYIKPGVYLNRHANYVIKTNIGQLQSKIREHMDGLYEEMVASGKKECVFKTDLKQKFPFLENLNIQSVYMKLLVLEEDSYGLFLIGDSKKDAFTENMSFYEAIIAQYNIAISNARIYNEMQHMAQKDGLTGINNRIHFNNLFKQMAEEITENKGCVSVALLDIDKFKNVNDTYGHLAGDEVIKRIATVTEECIEKYDGFVCRYGGEEFVAVLPNKNLEIAQSIIEEMFEKLCAQVVHYNEYDITMSVSVGLTAYPEMCKHTDELLKRADWCMYYAKEHGRHQINVDDGSIQRE